MRRYATTIIAFLALTALTAGAGDVVKLKPLMKAAKTAIKDGSKQQDAMNNLLAVVDSPSVTPQQRADIYFTCAELQKSLNDQQNLKLYLKQQYDTVQFFSTILGAYRYALKCDSIESAEKKQPHRSKGRGMLLTYRNNLLNGGKHLLKASKCEDAFAYFDMYLHSVAEPMFEKDALANDTILPRAAYWATVSAYSANKPELALRYVDQAIAGTDTATQASLTEYKANCLAAIRDSARWEATLREGMRRYVAHDYFYLHLMDFLNQKARYAEGLAISDSLMKAVGPRHIYWHVEAQMHMGLQDYDPCIECADKGIAADTTCVDCQYNKGIAYLNKAVTLSKTMDPDMRTPTGKRDRVKLRGLYQYAQEPMEKARQLAPDKKTLWAEPLYNIYLNLNLGDKFAEVEKILNEQ